MAGDVGSIRYSLREPFERAVESVCSALANRGLAVAGQLDISRRVERYLGIVLPACKIVFVLPDPSALSTPGIHPWAAIFLPLHIVISGNDTQTEIDVQNRVHPGSEDTAPALAAPIVQTQAQILAALEEVAVRPSQVV